jgi:uncharacterized protein (DUF433 family)
MKKSALAARRRASVKPREISQYLIAHPGVCFGKVTFKGTRVPVKTVLNFMAMGWTIEQILEDWPELTREAVVEALEMAAIAVDECWRVPKQGFKLPNEPTHSRRAR